MAQPQPLSRTSPDLKNPLLLEGASVYMLREGASLPGLRRCVKSQDRSPHTGDGRVKKEKKKKNTSLTMSLCLCINSPSSSWWKRRCSVPAPYPDSLSACSRNPDLILFRTATGQLKALTLLDSFTARSGHVIRVSSMRIKPNLPSRGSGGKCF